MGVLPKRLRARNGSSRKRRADSSRFLEGRRTQSHSCPMNRIFIMTLLAATTAPAFAQDRFVLEHRGLDSAGGRSTTSRFTFASSLDSFGAVGSTPTKRIQSGFIGQLTEPVRDFLLSIALSPASTILVRVHGAPNQPYQLQTAPSLTPPIPWSDVGAPRPAPANGILEFEDTATLPTRFYRVFAR